MNIQNTRTIEWNGKQVATVNYAGEIEWAEGVHHKTKEAVLKSLTEDVPASTKPAKKLDDPEPAQDPKYGDKTPSWALWLKRNNPEEFERRFFGRKIDLEAHNKQQEKLNEN